MEHRGRKQGIDWRMTIGTPPLLIGPTSFSASCPFFLVYLNNRITHLSTHWTSRGTWLLCHETQDTFLQHTPPGMPNNRWTDGLKCFVECLNQTRNGNLASYASGLMMIRKCSSSEGSTFNLQSQSMPISLFIFSGAIGLMAKTIEIFISWVRGREKCVIHHSSGSQPVLETAACH